MNRDDQVDDQVDQVDIDDQVDDQVEPCDQCGHEPCACCYFDDGPQDTRGIW